jgi:hypothetical protein
MLTGATQWADWPQQHGWWLANRAGTLDRLGPWQAG